MFISENPCEVFRVIHYQILNDQLPILGDLFILLSPIWRMHFLPQKRNRAVL